MLLSSLISIKNRREKSDILLFLWFILWCCQYHWIYSIKWWNVWWIMNRKGFGMKQSWSNQDTSHHLQAGAKENHKIPSLGSWCPSWDLDPAFLNISLACYHYTTTTSLMCSPVTLLDEWLKEFYENIQETFKNIIHKGWIGNTGMWSKETEGKFVLTFHFCITEKCVWDTLFIHLFICHGGLQNF
jgi:hypothetical protein